MSTISSLGIGSGLDLSSLLDSLQTAEEARLTTVTDKQDSYNTKLTAYGTLKSALESFNEATAALTTRSTYTQKVASSHDAFSTEVGDDAVSGSYSISVTQLATAQSLATSSSNSFSSTTALIGTSGSSNRQLSITVGSGDAVTIPLTDDQTTLSGLRDAINQADAGVTASIIQSGDSGYQLVITSDSTGSDATMTLAVSGDDKLNALIGYDGSDTDSTTGMVQTTAAQNALLTVNGISVERSSNTITDVPQGVTLTLNATTSSTQNLILRQSTTDSAKAIEDWVSAYNSLISTFNSLTQYTAVSAGEEQSDSNGALIGDSTLRTIQNQLKSQLSSAQSDSTFQVINDLGVTLNKDGTLSVDESTLVKNLANNPTAVADFFIGDGSTTGLATQMTNLASSYIDDNGMIDNATDSINTILTKLSKQYDSVQSSIDSNIARYKSQFTQLDVLITSLNSTSDYLTQQFEAISKTSSSS
ncbi:Flagellar hook-associated 2 domain protein [Sodalis praecaptivus]|uniref:Flagellar hook-associated protein 2 n=1 Tax=Sodalis praecaptivus TaxID=1239307 RepID=W0HU58_9GAMM|nr:flagellar filament capping protein FliD [Sodalis praecaptivus]AHF75755.1 Flagellar hook-associated 2 domain protein [Sodalis praecaptivus]